MVNNAGIPSTKPLIDTSEGDCGRVMAVNTKGTFPSMQHAARRMRDGGRIVSISTMSTVWASPGDPLTWQAKPPSSSSPASRRRNSDRAASVNAVSPGPADTDLLRGAVGDEALAATARMIPLGRLGRAATGGADMGAFLAGPDARWITGQNVRTTGGLVWSTGPTTGRCLPGLTLPNAV